MAEPACSICCPHQKASEKYKPLLWRLGWRSRREWWAHELLRLQPHQQSSCSGKCSRTKRGCPLFKKAPFLSALGVTCCQGSALFVGLSGRVHMTSVSFSGNWPLPTIRNEGQITWTCQPGYYHPTLGDEGTTECALNLPCVPHLPSPPLYAPPHMIPVLECSNGQFHGL